MWAKRMTSEGHDGGAQRGRDRVAMALMLVAAVGALVAFVGAVGTAIKAGPDTQVVISWRMYGFVLFAGLFVLLAFRPRESPGVWELVFGHKAAMSVTAAILGGSAKGAGLVAIVDGVLAVMTAAAYVLARGYTSWTRSSGHRRD